MIKQLFLALGLTSITVMIHAIGAVWVVRRLAGIWGPKASESPSPQVMPLVRLMSGLMFLHLVEMGIWASAFMLFGILPNFETALYFSLTSYTTVGYGDVLLPVDWRLIGPLEAAVGVLMLGWSTGFIVAAVQRTLSSRNGSSSND